MFVNVRDLNASEIFAVSGAGKEEDVTCDVTITPQFQNLMDWIMTGTANQGSGDWVLDTFDTNNDGDIFDEFATATEAVTVTVAAYGGPLGEILALAGGRLALGLELMDWAYEQTK